MVRRMADGAFREDQLRRRYEDHIAPINRLVDELSNTATGANPVRALPLLLQSLWGLIVSLFRRPSRSRD